MEQTGKIENEMIEASLVLEGGGMRGVYTAGVLEFFLERGLLFENCYGVSAGACHACSYLSGQKGRAFRVQVDYLQDKRYCSWYSLLKTGDLFGAEFCYHTIPEELDKYDYDAFLAYPGNFYTVVTNAVTGKAEYRKINNIRQDIDNVRASASLPWVSRPVKIDGNHYFDGGVADSIPVKRALQYSNKKVVTILTRDNTYRKKKDFMAKPAKLYYHRYPNLVQAMKERHIHYNDTLDFIRQEKEKGTVFVIQPKEEVKVSRIEKDRQLLEKLCRQGYEDAKEAYPALCRFLEGEI